MNFFVFFSPTLETGVLEFFCNTNALTPEKLKTF